MDWGSDLSGCLQEFATTAPMFLKFFSLDIQLIPFLHKSACSSTRPPSLPGTMFCHVMVKQPTNTEICSYRRPLSSMDGQGSQIQVPCK
ncbi:hypothetical protein NC652_035201 [Populus alba x Populus x berolinensis]|nr:hypothetical protein NC652_035201 [Populus alba x Populus x berolinensis]